MQVRACATTPWTPCIERSPLSRRHGNWAGRMTRSRTLHSQTASPITIASYSNDGSNESFFSGQPSQTQDSHDQEMRHQPDQPGYIGEQSLMSSSSSISVTATSNYGSFPEHIHSEIIKVTNATSLPSRSKVQVFTETYFTHLYHMAPVIDRADLAIEKPSALVLLAICLIGSQLRYPRDQCPTRLSESYYLKIKTLIYAKQEHDKLAILKTLCILCFWVITPPVVVSLDSSYHWLGVAVRLVYQMGLHRESSYLRLSNPGASRRLVWFIFVSYTIKTLNLSNQSLSARTNYRRRRSDVLSLYHLRASTCAR